MGRGWKDGTDRWVLIIKILSFSLSPGKLAAENRLRRDVSITNGRYCRTAEESLLPSSSLPHRRRGSPLAIVLLDRGWEPVLGRSNQPSALSSFLLISFPETHKSGEKLERNFISTYVSTEWTRELGDEKLARKEGRKEGRGGETGSWSNAEMKNRPVER